MIELNGEKCPKLFGKWQPKKFIDFYEYDESRLSTNYVFPFGIVRIESNNIFEPTHFLEFSGNGSSTEEFDFDSLFDNRPLEMYYDAKEHMNKLLSKLKLLCPEVKQRSINEFSRFGRCSGLMFSVDYENRSVSERNGFAKEIYTSLEQKLSEKFNASSEKLFECARMNLFIDGKEKEIDFKNGTFLVVQSPLEDEINAGRIYMQVISNEKGKKEVHECILETIETYLGENFNNHLQNWSGKYIYTGLKGSGPNFRIDFSRIKRKSLSSDFKLALLSDN